MMRWIESDGPLLLIPRSVVPHWGGGQSSEHGRGDDYDAACAVEGYVGVIERNGAPVVVVTGEPLPTTAVRLGSATALVRWEYAPSEEEASNLLRQLRAPDAYESEWYADFVSNEREWFLMSAVEDGRKPGVLIPVELEPGAYRVQVRQWSPTDDAAFLVYDFMRR